ncbi:MAG: hypothetical protein QW728_02070, partial [Thermoplasmata archaeon]
MQLIFNKVNSRKASFTVAILIFILIVTPLLSAVETISISAYKPHSFSVFHNGEGSISPPLFPNTEPQPYQISTIEDSSQIFSADNRVASATYNYILTVYTDNRYPWIDAVTGGTRLTAAQGDTARATIQLPFSFRFYDTTYPAGANLYIKSDGWVSFDDTPNPGYSSLPTSLPTTALGAAILLCCDDLDTSAAYYKVTGTSPNRVLTIEYSITKHWGSSATFQMQVNLYETSNDIVIQFGTINASSLDSSNVVGVNAGDGVFATAWRTLTDTDDNTDLLFQYPKYNDGMAVSIDSPVMFAAPGENIILATIRNMGLNANTIPVECTVRKVNGSNSTVVFTSSTITPVLLQYQQCQVQFGVAGNAWVAELDSNYTITVKTTLAGDENITNDMVTKSLSTRIYRDISVVSLNRPLSPTGSGANKINATVVNRGNVNDSFNASVKVMTVQTFNSTTLFFDDFEAGLGNWITGNWSINTTAVYNGTGCVQDSEGNYTNNSFAVLELNLTFDFMGLSSASISFMANYSFETNRDFCVLQASVVNG